MQLHDYMEAKDAFFALIAKCAPDQVPGMRHQWNKTEEVWTQPTDRKAIFVQMVGSLYDGIAYGNWPAIR